MCKYITAPEITVCEFVKKKKKVISFFTHLLISYSRLIQNPSTSGAADQTSVASLFFSSIRVKRTFTFLVRHLSHRERGLKLIH